MVHRSRDGPVFSPFGVARPWVWRYKGGVIWGWRPVSGFGHERRISSHKASAALRLRERQQAQGQGARRRQGHHRFRHGQSRHADAAPYRRKDDRGGARPEDASLFVVARHSGSAQGAGRLLRAPLRREAQPGNGSHRDARLEGRPRQSRPGDHGAGRCDPVPQSELSDSRLRLHHFGRRHPQRALREPVRFLRHAGARRSPQRAEACGARRQLPVQSDGAGGRHRFLSRDRRLCRQARPLHHFRSRLFRDLFRRQSAAVDPASARRARARRRVHLARPRPTTCPAGAWASRSATSASSTRLAA